MKIKLLFIAMMTTTFGWSQCNVNEATDCVCKEPGQVDCDLLPDIQASWYGILEYMDGPTEYPQTGAGSNNGRLRISVSTPNTGHGPLTVRGLDSNGYAYFLCDDDTVAIHQSDLGSTGGVIGGYYCGGSDEPAKHLAIQRIYHRNSDGTMTYSDRFAGTMTYHPTHQHMHSDEWGVFTLRKQDPNDPNPLNWPIVSEGAKMGFCLMDYNDCGDDAAYGHCRDENRYCDQYLLDYPEVAAQGFNGGNILTENNQFPNNGLGGQSYGCSPIEQGISVGSTDIYSEYLDEQWINIDPFLCNGEYWIVGEIDRQNFYLEESKENNWTAVPVTLTEQLEDQILQVSILTDGEPSICPGQSLNLSASIMSPAVDYVWSNGMTGPSISVNEAGIYHVEVISECGSSISESIEVTTNNVSLPTVSGATIDEGNSANLYAVGQGNIFWMNSSGQVIGEGNVYTTPTLYENTTYFVFQEEEIASAPDFLNTGEVEHLCDNESNSCDYSGTVYNGGLRFEALNDFTLNSIKVYAGLAGARTFELRNTTLNVIFESTTMDIPESEEDGFEVVLNWTIPAGEYIITTDADLNNQNFGGNNPLLKRTTGGLASFPHTVDNIINISEGYYNNEGNNISGAGFSTDYYYYFYDWKINNDWGIGELICSSDIVEVDVIVNNNNTDLIEDNSFEFSLFPNPASKELNIKPGANYNEKVSIFIINEIGEEVEKIEVNNFNKNIKLNVKDFSSGLYLIKIKSQNETQTKSIVIK